jgi:hypothetical protein
MVRKDLNFIVFNILLSLLGSNSTGDSSGGGGSSSNSTGDSSGGGGSSSNSTRNSSGGGGSSSNSTGNSSSKVHLLLF